MITLKWVLTCYTVPSPLRISTFGSRPSIFEIDNRRENHISPTIDATINNGSDSLLIYNHVMSGYIPMGLMIDASYGKILYNPERELCANTYVSCWIKE